MEEIEFSRWLFEGRPRQGKNVLPDGLNWLCYLAGSSKSHRQNSISCIFLESFHQVDMENVVKCYKHFFCYFNALKTNCDIVVCGVDFSLEKCSVKVSLTFFIYLFKFFLAQKSSLSVTEYICDNAYLHPFH